VDYFSLGSMSVSAHYQFLQTGGMFFIFSRHLLDSLIPTQTGSAQPSTPTLIRGGEIFPSFLSRNDAICPPAALDYVASSRADDMSHTPGRVAFILDGSRMAQAGRNLRFCVPELWRVQDITDDYRTCSAALCIVFLQEK
jgi:hypothetical protein